ncbi:MAG TPA: MFS transporter, partial [Burkholderiales bacterium]|nr:MFS transporter [Burkholderiales bacterium]
PRRYQNLFALPEIRSAMLSSMAGRLPIGIAGFAILLLVQHKTGSFALAGAASALYVLGLASVAPLLGRIIDRAGPAALLRACAIVYPAMLIALTALVTMNAHALAIALCALVAGAALPPVTICMRTLYPRVLKSPALLQTAFSVDSVIVETVFVIGPALVAFFLAFGFPEGAVLLAALTGSLGTVLFIRAPVIRDWEIRARSAAPRWGVFGEPGLVVLYIATIFYSVAFGLYEVGVTAYATNRSAPAAAGVALALASLGSAAGAFAYGARHWQAPLRKQFLIALGLMAAGSLIVAPIGNLYLFVLANIIAGMPMASVIATQSLLVSRLAPRGMLAESFTWGGTCLLGGISAGLALGGVLAERVAPPWILIAAAGATGIAALIAWSMPESEKLHVVGEHNT